jgi:hypothetical protein
MMVMLLMEAKRGGLCRVIYGENDADDGHDEGEGENDDDGYHDQDEGGEGVVEVCEEAACAARFAH